MKWNGIESYPFSSIGEPLNLMHQTKEDMYVCSVYRNRSFALCWCFAAVVGWITWDAISIAIFNAHRLWSTLNGWSGKE